MLCRLELPLIQSVEIEEKAEELGVHIANVQRDYVFGWLLAGLFDAANPLHAELTLKGGNAFRKGYFLNARYSNDLDFSTQAELDEGVLREAVAAAASFAGERSGVDFSVRSPITSVRSASDSDARMHEARVYFRSFYGEEDVTIKVDLDVAEFDHVLLPTQTRRLLHAFSDGESCVAEIKCWKLEELLASKLKALLFRQHSPDLYDFVHALFIQNALDVNRREVVATLLRKTIYEGTPGTLRALLLDLPFQVFRGLWNEYLVVPRMSSIQFEDAEERYRSAIPALFSLIAPVPALAGIGAHAPSHYPAGHRASIMEAGRLRRILRLVYDGVSRRVEPYALAFKRRRDGVAREYFYAWDLSGGHSGKVGIKSFIADRVQSIALTDETFEPRYPIELTKAGTGYFSSSTFGAPGTYGWRTRQPSARRSSPKAFTVRCPYCGKTFRRAKPNTRLTEHKDQYGNRCFGRIGTIV